MSVLFPSNSVSVYLIAGMRVKISAPVDSIKGLGWFVSHDPVTINSVERTPVRGFVVEDESVGTIEETEVEEAAVYYTHKLPTNNKIWFFADTGATGLVSVASVPIHDHSSLFQGGPAYGTFFSDDDTKRYT